MGKIIKHSKEENLYDTKKILKFYIFNIFLVFLIVFAPFFEKYINFLYNDYLSNNLNNSELVVTFIDVGQADCTFIEFPNKKCMMIDCGIDYDNSEYSVKNVNTFLERYYKNKDSKIIDYFIMTHPDYDHIGNAKYIFENYSVKTFFRPNIYSDYEIDKYGLSKNLVNYCNKDFYNDLMETIDNLTCESIMIDCFNKTNYDLLIAETKFQFLSPIKYKYYDTNDFSLVTKLECNDMSFIFTGDISSDVEKELINNYGETLKSDILKVAHHGGASASSKEFLELVKPKYAIISVGENNDYMHPNDKTLARLEQIVDAKTIIKTSKYGNISIGINNENYSINVCAEKVKFFETNFIKMFDIVCILEIMVLLKIMFTYIIQLKNDKSEDKL